MKKLLLVLLCLPLMTLAQQTYVPDDNFEDFLETYGMGNGIPNDDYVTTANINTVSNLNLAGYTIFDLTGIEDFTDLIQLNCGYNQLTCLNVSGCLSLYILYCHNNFLTQLDLSTNISLNVLKADGNPLLNCIQTVSNPTFTPIIDAGTLLSTNCSYGTILNCSGTTAIEEHTSSKELLKVTDLLGRETKQTNQPLFYIYDDGTVEKRIVIE
jgi:hypothetical protein